jgi:hypothetical protein
MNRSSKTDQWNEAIEKADHVEARRRDVLSHDHSDMVVLRITTALDIPVFDACIPYQPSCAKLTGRVRQRPRMTVPSM